MVRVKKTNFFHGDWLLWLALVCFGLVTAASERKLNLNEAKAHFIIEIARHLVWPEDEKIQSFKVGVLGNNAELIAIFSKKQSLLVRGKSFRVEAVNEASYNPGDYTILFLAEDRLYLNDLLAPQVSKTLLLADGMVGHAHLMIRLSHKDARLGVQLNRSNLTRRGFEVSSKLLALVGSRKDLSEQLYERETALQEVISDVSQKELELAELSEVYQENLALLEASEESLQANQILLARSQAELVKTQEELVRNRQALTEQSLQLTELIKAVELSQSQVDANRKAIAAQQQELAEKQQEISTKQLEIDSLETTLERNQRLLREQVKRLEQKAVIIDQRDYTIKLQKNWLLLIIGLALVFLVMSYYLFRENRLKKIANAKLEALNTQLFDMATTDAMTQLFNRRYFLECAQKELLRQSRNQYQAVMVMVDIDKFKQVNDSHGHIVGDEVLKSVARNLQNGMRQYDLVGRIGGEEFAMMLVDCDLKLASDIAQRLCDVTARTSVAYGSLDIKVTISIGLSQLTADDHNVEFPIIRADKALYHAKETGRNRVVLYEQAFAGTTSNNQVID